MHARLNPVASPTFSEFARHLIAADRSLANSTLPRSVQELVKLRASQINGCGFCTDMHAKDAVHAGESWERLNLVASWREATVFTDAERAALELAEQGTRVADAAGGVTDAAWENAALHYDEEQLAALVATISLINAFNRGNLIIRQPAGGYRAGRHA
ncbi:carboxymuconolactone decarboxylase family protein [Actinospica robiniae]|uniref:carboxymuconolactone decarboxylase family protein n=1 Tax=Actinospica robiniae TaxID=304901 RepID=UPI00042529A3|nr:carboxymuconolactone decarboxylase family protein [Actinospica robiniae]